MRHSSFLSRHRERSQAKCYTSAVVFTALALAVNFLLSHASLPTRNFLFAGAVLASAVYGGFLPGMLATLLSAALSSYLFLVPVASFEIADPENIQRLMFFLLEGTVISGVGQLARHTPSTRTRDPLFRYVLAVALTGLVAGIKVLVFPIIAHKVPFAFCYALAVGIAWAAGLGPALAGIGISGIAGYFFVPENAFSREERTMMFVLEATLLALLAGSYRTIFMRIEAYLLRLFFDSPAGIMVLRPDFVVLRANPAMHHMLPARPSGLEGTSLYDLLHPSSREWLPSVLSRLDVNSEPAYAHEVRFLNDSKDVWAELQAAPLDLPGQRERGWLLTIEDTTDHHETESRMREIETRLHQAQKLEAVGLLASSIAHDFNNQLTVILAYADELLRKRSSDEEVRSDVLEISRASQRAGDFARQLVDFARRDLRTRDCIDVNAVVGDNRLFLARLLGDEIELLTELDPRLQLVMADAGRIEQILLNLVANAKDAMPHGGTLFIRTSNTTFDEPVPAVKAVMPAGHYVALAVIDNGEGIDPAMQERIFDPFFTTKDPCQGTGLGLATVYRNATQLNGFIRVSSTPGEGTEMILYLPAAGTHVPAQAAVPDMRRPRTVLVVEDEDSLRALMVRVLGSAGYRVLEAADGDGALATAARWKGRLDVMVSDMHMPGMHITEVAQRLRKANPNLRVLYVSGDPSQATVEPETPFLAKPFNPQDLVTRVAEL